MIEISELDHVLSLARDRLDAGRKNEALDYFDQLIGSFNTTPNWVWPEARRAQWSILSGLPVDWGSAREEFLLAINSEIISSLNEKEAERKGSAKGVRQRQKNSNFIKQNVLDEVRQIHDPGRSAEWHRRKLNRLGLNSPSVRSLQRYLKEIRASQ